MTESTMPQGPNMAMLSSMQQSAGSDPSQRLVSALPGLGYTIGGPQGLNNTKIMPPLFFASVGQSGSAIGPFSFVKQALQACFVDTATMSSWNTSGLEQVIAAHIDSAPIEGAAIEARIAEAAPIEGAPIRGVLDDVSSVSAPSQVMAHQNTVNITNNQAANIG